MWRYKLTKKWRKNDQNRRVKNRPKNCLKIDFHGGGQNDKNRPFLMPDPGDPIFINFLKFCTFLQKLPTFWPPKSTPINDLIKISFPTKTPVLLLRGGSKNVTFWGVGGRTARTEKCRHYYIAKTGNRGPKVVEIYRFFTPTRSHT
jgi:hypothetical protein